MPCTGRERSAITQIANGREGRYRVISARPRTPRCDGSRPQRPALRTTPSSMRSGARGCGINHLGGRDEQQEVGADLDAVALLEQPLLDPLAVHKGAVEA